MLCKLRPPPRCSDLLSSFGSPLPALTPRHRQTFPLNNLYRRTQHLRRANRSTFLGGRFGKPNLCLPQQSLNICPRYSPCSRSIQHCRRTCLQRKYRSQRSVRSHRWRSLAGKKYKSRASPPPPFLLLFLGHPPLLTIPHVRQDVLLHIVPMAALYHGIF